MSSSAKVVHSGRLRPILSVLKTFQNKHSSLSVRGVSDRAKYEHLHLFFFQILITNV
jgi:hypothetical protein